MEGTQAQEEAAQVPEGQRNALLDVMLEHWPRIAAAAWDGFASRGRGTVTIEAGSIPPELDYRAGSPCPCHEAAVATYDPETQAVVAVLRTHDAEVTWIEMLGGWPTPQDAASVMNADARGETVQ